MFRIAGLLRTMAVIVLLVCATPRPSSATIDPLAHYLKVVHGDANPAIGAPYVRVGTRALGTGASAFRLYFYQGNDARIVVRNGAGAVYEMPEVVGREIAGVRPAVVGGRAAVAFVLKSCPSADCRDEEVRIVRGTRGLEVRRWLAGVAAPTAIAFRPVRLERVDVEAVLAVSAARTEQERREHEAAALAAGAAERAAAEEAARRMVEAEHRRRVEAGLGRILPTDGREVFADRVVSHSAADGSQADCGRTPCVMTSYAGRSRVMILHPLSNANEASCEFEMYAPAGRPLRLRVSAIHAAEVSGHGKAAQYSRMYVSLVVRWSDSTEVLLRNVALKYVDGWLDYEREIVSTRDEIATVTLTVRPGYNNDEAREYFGLQAFCVTDSKP